MELKVLNNRDIDLKSYRSALLVSLSQTTEVRAVVWQQEGCWLDPRGLLPLLAKCGGVPEQDAT